MLGIPVIAQLPIGLAIGTASVLAPWALRPFIIVGATLLVMQAGLFWGYMGLIETIVARIKEEYGKPMTVIATGGLANIFYGQTKAIQHLDLDLTIRGLALIHARAAK